MDLVIVESPTKAKTISRFLGKDFKVLASFGHVRDLPKSKLGVDVDHGFEPTYVVPPDSKAKVKDLKDAAKKAKRVLLATDEDREGEAISWHIATLLDLDPEKAQRITFHEITEHAIKHALEHPRTLDLRLVDAQQARRILDRLVGYKLSPYLWRHVARGLSAGRVQSVAVRLIVEREREILAFKPEEYWTIDATLKAKTSEDTFEAKLNALNGKSLDKMAIPSKEEADKLVAEFHASPFTVTSVEKKAKHVNPPAPFTTSTLQQEANKRLGFSSKQTMMIAQRLYEGMDIGTGTVGLITYMRTDSVNLADSFLEATNAHVKQTYGDTYALKEPRKFKTKSKGAQEAHEAIRPTDPTRTPESLASHLDPQDLKLYDLIWRRAVATQMSSAELEATSADITAGRGTFRATGQTVVFDGYLKLFPDQDKDKFLPELNEKDTVNLVALDGTQHFTEPPARFSDATIVKALEESGIGRPSTYAPTLSTIVDRGYVERDEKKRFVPTQIGMSVNDLLVKQFPNIVDLEFTSRMEESLDRVAEGVIEWRPLLAAFYGPLAIELAQKEQETVAEDEKAAAEAKCDKCGSAMSVKTGRFGKFLACTNYPECKGTKPLGNEKPREAPKPVDDICPTCGAGMVERVGRFGPFISCSKYPECKTIKRIDKFVSDANGVTIPCPKCHQGQIIEKRSKKGKIFFSCNRYPDCDQAFWDKPTGEKCPSCGFATLTIKGKKIVCPQEDCSYSRSVDAEG